MGKIKAVICGYYGKGNAGDEALLMSLLQMLPDRVTPLVLSGNPTQTGERYGVESYGNRSPSSILQALNQADALIWGGGSLMQDVTSLASPIYYAGLMQWAQLLERKTIAWAQGIGPLRSPFTRLLTRRVLRGCNAISVRDSASEELLAGWEIPAILAPDPVWALEGKLVRHLLDLPQPRVAVNLRTHPRLTPQRLQSLIQALITFQQITGVSLVLLPFQESQDGAIARTIATQLSGSHQIISLADPKELKGLFREITMVIGMRYHSLIMASAEGCRCFALSYDPKVSRLIEELNLPGWELEQIPADPELICNNWLETYSKGEALGQNQIQSLIDRALKHQELLKENLLG
jgi:polysaccharide pyruvyl transferase CsaB